MNEIKNTEHLNKKDKENLQDFFEKYSLAWHIAKEFERLQNKTRLEQQAEKAKERLAEISTSVDVVAEHNRPKPTSVVRTLKTSIFEVSDMIRVFTKPVGHFVNIHDGFVEYKKTGDTIKVVTKIGSNVASGSIMMAGGYASLKAAIAAGTASSVFLTPIGGAIVGIAVFVTGIGASYWISDNFGTALNAGVNGVIDYIRETDFTFSPNFIEYNKLDTVSTAHLINTAHCHQTFETRNRQKFLKYGLGDIHKKQIFINGLNATDKLYPNDKILPPNVFQLMRLDIDKLTPKQLEELADTIEQLKEK